MQGRAFDWDGVKGKVLWPADISAVSKASNDDSLVMRIQDGAESFLLPGDIEKHVENELVDQQAMLACGFSEGAASWQQDVFDGCVRGSGGAESGRGFCGRRQPIWASGGCVVERYAAAGVRFLRTDRDGAVTAITDGHDLVVHTFVEEHPR